MSSSRKNSATSLKASRDLALRQLRELDFNAVLEDIGNTVKKDFGKGKVASYIPALKRVSPRKLGIAICTMDGEEYVFGDATEPFSIQSISKVFTLLLALGHAGSGLWKRVGREPSGTAFNSLVQLEQEKGIPRNPFINAGAHVVTDCLLKHDAKARKTLLDFVRSLSGNKGVCYDKEVARSEKEHGHGNAAIAHFLKKYGNLACTVDDVLDLYFHQCAISMSCIDLARSFAPLANQGEDSANGAKIIHRHRVKRVNSLMLTSGVYDGAGNFAYRVGIPCKSGVGGGIAGVIPRRLSICVWSPELDEIGNSYVGTRVLELFTTKTGLSIF